MAKGVIFDMDGVLVDNMEVHKIVFEKFCRKYGCEINDTDWERYAGKGNDEIIPMVMPAHIVAEYGAEALGHEKEAMYREYYAPFIAPVAGLVELLESLRRAGIKMAVGSSGEKANVDFVLEKCGIAHYFDVAVNGDMVARRKPDPAIFLLAAQKLGLEPQECVVFEDSFSGMEAARRAGMAFIALATTSDRKTIEKSDAHPLMIIDNFRGLTAADIEKA